MVSWYYVAVFAWYVCHLSSSQSPFIAFLPFLNGTGTPPKTQSVLPT